MLLEVGAITRLGVPESVLRVREGDAGQHAWSGRRLLFLGAEPAYELSFWCGTCAFLFQRLEGARTTLSVEELADRLGAGLDAIGGSYRRRSRRCSRRAITCLCCCAWRPGW